MSGPIQSILHPSNPEVSDAGARRIAVETAENPAINHAVKLGVAHFIAKINSDPDSPYGHLVPNLSRLFQLMDPKNLAKLSRMPVIENKRKPGNRAKLILGDRLTDSVDPVNQFTFRCKGTPIQEIPDIQNSLSRGAHADRRAGLGAHAIIGDYGIMRGTPRSTVHFEFSDVKRENGIIVVSNRTGIRLSLVGGDIWEVHGVSYGPTGGILHELDYPEIQMSVSDNVIEGLQTLAGPEEYTPLLD